MMEYHEQIIQNYITAYNNFDVYGMLRAMAPSIRFENVSNGEMDMVLNGLAEFREQAEKTSVLFSERKQTVTAWKHDGEHTEVTIDYYGVLATDLPNGYKKGDAINLSGRAVFTFADNRITGLNDIS